MGLINKLARGIVLSSLIGMSFFQCNYTKRTEEIKLNVTNRKIFIPEYKRELNNVLMKFQPEMKYQDDLIKEVLNYSNVYFLTPDFSNKESKNFFKSLKDKKHKIIPIYIEETERLRQAWSQDLFEFLVRDETEKVIFPNYFQKDSSLTPFINFLEKDSILYSLSNNNFEGGHLVYDYFNGKNLIFTGAKGFLSNHYISNVNSEKIINYKEEFGADSVIFFEVNSNETPLFHIDQCFTFVDSGKVALLNLNDYSLEDFYFEKEEGISVFEKEFYLNYSSVGANQILISEVIEKSLDYSKKMLTNMKNKFTKLGYQVYSLPTSYWQILNYQSYMNSRLFVDGGKRKILMPIFPNLEGIYDVNYFRNKNAKEFFENLGLEVISVENKSWEKQGNIHCLINEI